MSYISTFDSTFIALWIYYAVSMATAAGIWRVWGDEFIRPGNVSLRYVRWISNGMWFVVLAGAMYYSIEGFTTFLATCVLVACAVVPLDRYMAGRRLQRELGDSGNHMIDTRPTPLA